MKKVAVLGGVRIPFARSGTQYKRLGNLDLTGPTLNALVKKYSLQGELMGDVAIGSVIKSGRDFNLARETVLETPLHPATPAFDVQRACGTSLEGATLIANKIALGQIECGIAGGSDSNSVVPIEFGEAFASRAVEMYRAKTWMDKLRAWKGAGPNDFLPVLLQVIEPRTGLSMGEHCEKMAQEWGISRAEQDKLAVLSHSTAIKAYENGFYSDLVSPFGGLEMDNNLRKGTSVEKLAKLKPVFERSEKGTLTAANSTPLTDGAAMALLSTEEWAAKRNIPIQCYFVSAQASAVDFVSGEGLLMAPTTAVAKLLARLNLKLSDFDFYEIHEAFAAQALCTLAAWESDAYCAKMGFEKALGSIDRNRLNVVGGSVGIGHPFAATGARLVATGAKLLAEKGKGRALLSACTAGGMGVAVVLER